MSEAGNSAARLRALTPFAAALTLVMLLAAVVAASGAPAAGPAVENGPPAQPKLSIDDVAVKEGDSGTTFMVFTASLSAPASQAVSFSAATTDYTATGAGGDYYGASGRVTIPAGQTSAKLLIAVRGDTRVEKIEIFSVNLSQLVGADAGDLLGIGAIVNDDAPPSSGLFGFTLAWGQEGTAPGLFGSGRQPSGGARQYDDPGGLAIVGGGAAASSASAAAAPTLVVVDPSNDRVQRFTLDGKLIARFGAIGFDPGASTTVEAKGLYQNPVGLASDSAGHLFIADSRNDRVIEVSASGRFMRRIGRRGAGTGRFVFPNSLTVVGHTLYIVDRANTRIQKWSTTGRYLGTIGRFGPQPGGLLFPNDVKAHNGELYVTDSMKNQVLVFTLSGRFKRAFGTSGRGRGQMVLASGLAFTKAGHVLVGDRCNKRVDAFTTAGAFVGTIGVGRLKTPTFLATDPAGNLFVSDYHRVVKFAPHAAALRPSSALRAGPSGAPTASAAHHLDRGRGLDILCRDEPRSAKRWPFRGMSLRSDTARLDFSGNAYVRSYCGARIYWNCRGTITISYRGRKVGAAPITVGSNDAPTVLVPLVSSMRRLVHSRHRVRAQVTYRVHDNQIHPRFATTRGTLFVTG